AVVSADGGGEHGPPIVARPLAANQVPANGPTAWLVIQFSGSTIIACSFDGQEARSMSEFFYPGFPRWLGRFGMAFAPFPWKTQRFRPLPAETAEEPHG